MTLPYLGDEPIHQVTTTMECLVGYMRPTPRCRESDSVLSLQTPKGTARVWVFGSYLPSSVGVDVISQQVERRRIDPRRKETE